MPSRTTLFGLATMGLALVVALWADPGRAVRVGPSRLQPDVVAPATVASALHSDEPAAPAVPVERSAVAAEPSPAPRPQRARDFLAGYYGARWPEIEQRIEAAGQDLDQPYSFTPWEDVEAQFEGLVGMSATGRASVVRDQVRWTDELTPEFLRTTFELGDSFAIEAGDLVAIEALVDARNREIAALAEHYCAMIDAFVRAKWASGDFLRAPYTTAGLSQEMGFHSQSHGGLGWAVTITLTRERYPEVVPVEERMSELVGERDESVLAYLRQRFGR